MNFKKILETVIFRQICDHYNYDPDDIDLIRSYIYQTAIDDSNMFSFQMLITDVRNSVEWNVNGVIVDGLVIIRSRD